MVLLTYHYLVDSIKGFFYQSSIVIDHNDYSNDGEKFYIVLFNEFNVRVEIRYLMTLIKWWVTDFEFFACFEVTSRGSRVWHFFRG